MIKKIIYILLITTLAACSNFKGKDENVEIDSRGNVTNKDIEGQTAEQIYSIAKTALKSSSYDVAIENYRKIEANFPFSKYAEQSHIELAYAMYKLNRWDGSISVIDRFISMNNTSKMLPYAYYLRGLNNFSRGKTFYNYILPHVQIDKDPLNIRSSYDDFNYVYKNYKNSKYAKDSLKRMVYLRNTLASYELHVANYYFKRKAYIAVINRCNYIIEKYPSAPANKEALFFLKKSYESLLMNDNVRLIEKVIKKNYPEYQSVYFNDAIGNKAKQNLIAISEVADDIAISMGFDIENQVEDNFDSVYNVEYFTNDNLVEIPRSIKPEKYSIKHTAISNKKSIKNDEDQLNIFDYFSTEDTKDLNVKDIIVGEIVDQSPNEKHLNNEEKEENKNTEIIDSENEVIELIK
jgi:outer membrane protein assembly factor BamD